jgi:uncharacterized protein
MANTKTLTNLTNPKSPVLNVKTCDTFFTRLAGLMFKKSLAETEAIALVYPRESRIDTSIHMFFMNFDITAIWLNQDLVVVDIVLAKRWNSFYASSLPASIVVEASPARFSDFQMGDQVAFR